MGKKSPSPPAAPDPAATAAAQAAANKDAVRESALVNQINEVSPYGSLTYTGEVGEPDRTRTTTMNPQAQEIYDQQQDIAGDLTRFGASTIPQVADRLATPFSLDGLPGAPQASDTARQRVEEALFSRLEPRFARDEAAMRTRLANQGISQGAEAYTSAMGDFNQAKNDARMAAILAGGGEQSRQFGLEGAARDRGLSESLLERSQPLNEMAALLQGAPAIGSPQFGQQAQYQVAPADVFGPQAMAYQGAQNQYNQQMGSNNAAMGGLYGLGGALGGAAITGMMPSDRRVKTAIKRVGSTDDGLGVYTFKYIGDDVTQMGVMAQEVEMVHPDAVHEIGGIKHVDYARL